MTTICAEVSATVASDVRQFGMAKEVVIARQLVLVAVQISEGLPIYLEVSEGNTAETKTMLPIVKKGMQRVPHLRRRVPVADLRLLSLECVRSTSPTPSGPTSRPS
jgi:transposase